MECEHKKIIMVNMQGKNLEKGHEVDFIIKCHNCNEELFRISEHKRTIINLSKH